MKSTAIALVKPITAAFVLPYTNRLGAAFMPETTEGTMMMFPCFHWSMPGKTARQVRNIDFRLTSNEKSQSVSRQSRIVL